MSSTPSSFGCCRFSPIAQLLEVGRARFFNSLHFVLRGCFPLAAENHRLPPPLQLHQTHRRHCLHQRHYQTTATDLCYTIAPSTANFLFVSFSMSDVCSICCKFTSMCFIVHYSDALIMARWTHYKNKLLHSRSWCAQLVATVVHAHHSSVGSKPANIRSRTPARSQSHQQQGKRYSMMQMAHRGLQWRARLMAPLSNSIELR